jgi:hypothetical protein
VLGKKGQTNQVIQRTDNSELPEIQQDWVKVNVTRQQGSSRDMRAKLSLLTLYLAIQSHMLSAIKSMSSQQVGECGQTKTSKAKGTKKVPWHWDDVHQKHSIT